MSEVLEAKRKPQKLEVHVRQIELICYTVQITRGAKFAPQYRYQEAIIARIIGKAMDIYTLSWEANNIRVDGDEDKFKRRKALQERAVESCDSLLGLFQIAKMMFHQKGKQNKTWCEKVVAVKKMTQAWKDKNSEDFTKDKKEQVQD